MDKVVVSDSKSLQSFFSVTCTFDWTNDQLNEVHKRARQLEKLSSQLQSGEIADELARSEGASSNRSTADLLAFDLPYCARLVAHYARLADAFADGAFNSESKSFGAECLLLGLSASPLVLLLEALLPRVFAVPQRVLIVPLHPALAQSATALVQRAPELFSSVKVAPLPEASNGALLSTLRAIASAAQAGAPLLAVHVLGGLPDLNATGSPSDLLPLVPSSNAEQQQRYTEALSALASLAISTRVALDASFNLPTGGCPGAGAAPGLVARSVFIVLQGTDLHSAAQALIDDLLLANAQLAITPHEVLVQQSVYPQFRAILNERVEALVGASGKALDLKLLDSKAQTRFLSLVHQLRQLPDVELLEPRSSRGGKLTAPTFALGAQLFDARLEEQEADVKAATGDDANATTANAMPANAGLTGAGPLAFVTAFRTTNELLSLANSHAGVGASASVWCEDSALLFELVRVLRYRSIWLSCARQLEPAAQFQLATSTSTSLVTQTLPRDLLSLPSNLPAEASSASAVQGPIVVDLPLKQAFNLFVGGKSVPSQSSRALELLDPLSGKTLATSVANTSRADVQSAVNGLLGAFQSAAGWRAATGEKRIACLRQLLALLEKPETSADLVRAQAAIYRPSGDDKFDKIASGVRQEIRKCLVAGRRLLANGVDLLSSKFVEVSASSSAIVGRQPIGVVALIDTVELSREAVATSSVFAFFTGGFLALLLSLLHGSPVLVVPSRSSLLVWLTFTNVLKQVDVVLASAIAAVAPTAECARAFGTHHGLASVAVLCSGPVPSTPTAAAPTPASAPAAETFGLSAPALTELASACLARGRPFVAVRVGSGSSGLDEQAALAACTAPRALLLHHSTIISNV